MKDLLLKYGFVKGKVKNEYKYGKTIVAVIGNDLTHVSITRYSPIYYRFLWEKTYSDKQELEKYFKDNFIF